ncbi:Asp-tRNA(Asn)/Glu-tRNA(Gln) amidotransferase subunit GatA, partial [Desulfococcaceae bacterium OttesenSCG-928-F15]|nr:Asp-tRNA(Asn)/Glu-tRNA(Gln) amidotransferase subunit GatA [Desulfococcaceae bacterium OttesenSCG-928-F15]
AEGMNPDVRSTVGEAVRVLESCGAKVVQVHLPHTSHAVAVYYLIAPSEASANLARFDGIRYGFRAEGYEDLLDLYEKSRSEGFGDEVKLRILIGTYALSSGYYDAYYLKALKVRNLIARDFEEAFRSCDVIAAPVAPSPPCALNFAEGNPLAMYLADIFTISANLAGIPGISVPCGFSRAGLPIGFQLLGKAFDEGTVLKVAHAYEKEAALHIPLAEPGERKS